MPRHDDRHAPHDVDMAITVVFVLVLIAVLLLLSGTARPYMPARTSNVIQETVPAVPPM